MKKRRNEMRLRRGQGMVSMDGDKRDRAESLLRELWHQQLKHEKLRKNRGRSRIKP